MCLYPYKGTGCGKHSRKSPYTVHEKRKSQLPPRLEIRHFDGSSSPQRETFVSESELNRLEEQAKLDRVRAAEKAELEMYQKAERAEQEKIKATEKAELERLRIVQKEDREQKAKDEKKRVEKLEKELKALKRRGDNTEFPYEGSWVDEDDAAMEIQLFRHQQPHQVRKQRRSEILEDIEFVQSLGKKFIPPPPAPTNTTKQEKTKLDNESSLHSELNKLRSDLEEMKLDSKLAKMRAEGTRDGLREGEAKARKEIEFRRELEEDMLEAGRRRFGNRDDARRWKPGKIQRERRSSSDSEDSFEAYVERRKVGDKTKLMVEPNGDINLTALARLPGPWNFAISSPPAPGNSIQKAQASSLTPPRPRMYGREDRNDTWEREREKVEQRERIVRMEERFYQERLAKERERQWVKDRDEKEWRERMLNLQCGGHGMNHRQERFGPGHGGEWPRGDWGGHGGWDRC